MYVFTIHTQQLYPAAVNHRPGVRSMLYVFVKTECFKRPVRITVYHASGYPFSDHRFNNDGNAVYVFCSHRRLFVQPVV